MVENVTQLDRIEKLLEESIKVSPSEITRDQAAEILGCSAAAIDLWTRSGRVVNGVRYFLEKKDKGKIDHKSVLVLKSKIG
jgi:phage terminase Nu1 subunit (DNA packaging protein)